MKVFRKALIASAVGLAMASTAQGATVLFDVNGAAGPNAIGTDRFFISLFDWAPGNLLIHDTTPVVSGAAVNIFSEADLSKISGPAAGALQPTKVNFTYDGTNAVHTGQLTYQLLLNTTSTAGAGGSINYDQRVDGLGDPVAGTIKVYYNSAAIADDVTGCGYGDSSVAAAANVANTLAHCGAFPGTLIYTGSVTLTATANLTPGTLNPGGLDQSDDAVDNDSGIGTNSLGLGTLTLDVKTDFANPAFFITPFGGFPTTLQHTEQGGGAPFGQANPSDEVVGNLIDTSAAARTATYGSDLVNNIGAGSCGATSNNPCDVHLQSDASSTIVATTPEPGSLALLSLGFGLLGFSLRKARRA